MLFIVLFKIPLLYVVLFNISFAALFGPIAFFLDYAYVKEITLSERVAILQKGCDIFEGLTFCLVVSLFICSVIGLTGLIGEQSIMDIVEVLAIALLITVVNLLLGYHFSEMKAS